MKKILKNRKIYWTALLCMLLLLEDFRQQFMVMRECLRQAVPEIL